MGIDLSMLKRPDRLDGVRDFRIGHWGMGALHDVMSEVGLIDTQFLPPDFEEPWPPAGMDEDRADEILQYLDENDEADAAARYGASELAAICKYQAARNAWASLGCPEPGKIPSYKFGSDDNPIVNPTECRVVAEAMEKLLQELDEDEDRLTELAERVGWDGDPDDLYGLIEEWQEYNEVAAKYGGYRLS